MIEYANPEVIKLLKQYKMLSKSLKFTTDLKQRNDLYDQMTKIIENVLEITNKIYKEKYIQISNRSVYLMKDEKNRLLELINLINERKTYVNNQIETNKELTGITIYNDNILGEENLEKYQNQVKIIDKFKNNIHLEIVLKEEIKSLDYNIKKANAKISNNQLLNKRLETNMIKIIDEALEKLSLYELKEREKEIDLAYTELGYSLEKAKENAKIARRDYSEEIVLECDNMLSAITLEYERYKEKKLILKLIYIFKDKVNNYEEMLEKREKINSIMTSITSSELYSMIGKELNKEYATIKLEGQDIATLKSLMEEKEIKTKKLSEIKEENDSEEFKQTLSGLLENEKKHQEKMEIERQKKEQEKQEKLKELEKIKKEELAKRQKVLEEERKKEIEERTKQLLVEKKNPILLSQREDKKIEKIVKNNNKDNNDFNKKITTDKNKDDLFIKKSHTERKEDIFTKKNINPKVVDKGIPVIKNNRLDNEVKSTKATNIKDNKIFPEIPLEKKENIFPAFPEINTDNENSFFDEDEFNDLSNYMENNNKKSWF